MTLSQAKKRLRAEMIETRRRIAARPGAVRAAVAVRDRFMACLGAGAGAGGPLAGTVVSAYWPIGGELDPRPLLHALAARGAVCALPAVAGRGRPLAFRRWRPGDALVEARFGLREPAAAAAPVTPEIVVAPLLAVDPAGRRLGYGGGYYDRTIAALRAGSSRGGSRAVVVGVGYDAQIVDAVPAGQGDMRVDWMISEARTLACAGAE